MSETLSPITFHVFRKDGSKNPDIKAFFLERQRLTAMDAVKGTITLSDKTVWTLVMETSVSKALKEQHEVLCIISFQARQQGNYAVARLYDAAYRPKIQRTNTKGANRG